MEKANLYDELVGIENKLQDTLTQVSELKEAMEIMLEKNVSLELENQHLRKHLEKLGPDNLSSTNKQELSKSRLNLEKLYEEGFHVCKTFYGTRRENNEECLICSGMIYGKKLV